MIKSGNAKGLRLSALLYVLGLFIVAEGPINMAAASTSALQISVNKALESQEYGWVYVTGVDPSVLARLRERHPELNEWRRMFSVQAHAKSLRFKSDKLPNIAGRYNVLESGLRFVPSFTPTPGVAYHISLRIDGHKTTQGVFAFNDVPASAQLVTEVAAVYPSANSIPENTLRLYVHFSSPMQRGQVEEKIRLLDEHGAVIQDAFVTGPLGELWDPEQRRLTLLLDPGRIKRGVAPNRKLGPALKIGDRRTLHIDGQFADAKGRPMKAGFRKTYEISEAIRDAVSPGRWTITAPASGSQAPLQIRFDRALDSGMLLHAMGVQEVNGAKIAGHAAFSDNETAWIFTPAEPWSGNTHVIQVATILEDISGNNLLAPLDVNVSPQHPVIANESDGNYKTVHFVPAQSNSE